MQICIFEGINYERLEPLIYPRPVYNLVCGINTLRDKIMRSYPGVECSYHCRPYIVPFLKEKYPDLNVNTILYDKCLFINGAVLADENFAKMIPLNDPQDKLYVNDYTVVAARVSGKNLARIKDSMHDMLSESDFDGLPIEKVDVKCIEYVWDLINNNHTQMIKDYHYLTGGKTDKHRGKVFDGVHIIERDNVFIAEGAEIKPGVVLDASKGPIYIDTNAIVYPNAVIEGPVYVGKGAQVKSCARIFENVSIGKISKVGGEVEDSIILPYTNKQHAGFLGHAYLGSWVNLGADTNCSDLKNNYGDVKIYVNGELVNSKCQFLGVIMGDHSKTAINTMFNTGSVIGFSCNIFGAGFPDKYIPSFSWGGSDAITTYDIERSIETAKRVKARRDRKMIDAEEKLFRKIFDITKKERRKRGYPY